MAEQRFAGRGDPYLARQAFEQGGLQFLFQVGDLVAERRLHDVAALGGAGEVALFGQGHAELELFEVHAMVSAMHLFLRCIG